MKHIVECNVVYINFNVFCLKLLIIVISLCSIVFLLMEIEIIHS